MLKRGILVFLLVMGSVYALSGDFDNDGEVDFEDFLGFARHYNENQINDSNREFNLNEDGRIDFSDFLIFAANFGRIPGDFDGNSCLDNNDLLLAKEELLDFDDRRPTAVYTSIGNYPDDHSIISQSESLNNELAILTRRYDLNGDGFIFSHSPEKGLNLAKLDKAIFDDFREDNECASSGIRGDFDNNGCLNNNDRSYANDELSDFILAIGGYNGLAGGGLSIADISGTGGGFTVTLKGEGVNEFDDKLQELTSKYDLNGNGFIFQNFRGTIILSLADGFAFDGISENRCGEVSEPVEFEVVAGDPCAIYGGDDRNKCYILAAAKVSVLDQNLCENIDEDGNLISDTENEIKLKNICRQKVAIGMQSQSSQITGVVLEEGEEEFCFDNLIPTEITPRIGEAQTSRAQLYGDYDEVTKFQENNGNFVYRDFGDIRNFFWKFHTVFYEVEMDQEFVEPPTFTKAEATFGTGLKNARVVWYRDTGAVFKGRTYQDGTRSSVVSPEKNLLPHDYNPIIQEFRTYFENEGEREFRKYELNGNPPQNENGPPWNMPAIPRNPRYWSDRVDEDSDFAQITPLGENKYQVRLKSLSWFFVSHGNYGLNLWAPVKPDNQRFSYCVKGEVK